MHAPVRTTSGCEASPAESLRARGPRRAASQGERAHAAFACLGGAGRERTRLRAQPPASSGHQWCRQDCACAQQQRGGQRREAGSAAAVASTRCATAAAARASRRADALALDANLLSLRRRCKAEEGTPPPRASRPRGSATTPPRAVVGAHQAVVEDDLNHVEPLLREPLHVAQCARRRRRRPRPTASQQQQQRRRRRHLHSRPRQACSWPAACSPHAGDPATRQAPRSSTLASTGAGTRARAAMRGRDRRSPRPATAAAAAASQTATGCSATPFARCGRCALGGVGGVPAGVGESACDDALPARARPRLLARALSQVVPAVRVNAAATRGYAAGHGGACARWAHNPLARRLRPPAHAPARAPSVERRPRT